MTVQLVTVQANVGYPSSVALSFLATALLSRASESLSRFLAAYRAVAYEFTSDEETGPLIGAFSLSEYVCASTGSRSLIIALFAGLADDPFTPTLNDGDIRSASIDVEAIRIRGVDETGAYTVVCTDNNGKISAEKTYDTVPS